MERLARDGCGELSVDENVGVTTDRRREVRVDRRGETVVGELRGGQTSRAEVLGGEHAAGGHDADEGVEFREGRVL
jgi:hypothetical protein